MTKKKKYIGIAAVIVALLVVGIVSALPQNHGAGKGQGLFMGGCFDQLTEEQREALNQIIEELREAGATPEEIRDAVKAFLEEQGIDTEDCFGPGHKRKQHEA
jgi:hypothetical protein